VLDGMHALLHIYEHVPSLPLVSSLLPLRQKALARVYQLLTYEDENTGYQTIGPVSKAFNMVCRFAHDGPHHPSFNAHRIKVENFLWMGRDGLMMTGTDGSQLWDLTFISQAMKETGLALEEENKKSSLGMLQWMERAQIRGNSKWFKEDYRHQTKGAWAFSTQEQGYVVCHSPSTGPQLFHTSMYDTVTSDAAYRPGLPWLS
jgi:lanosterol synthase